MDDDIIIGIMTALYSMAEKSVKDTIKFITLNNKRLYYQIIDPLLAVIITEKNKNPKKYIKMTEKILKNFIKRYPINFTKQLLSTEFFRDYEEEIDRFR